jgi:hypothetical protein
MDKNNIDNIDDSDLQKQKIESLLTEFASHRIAIKDMITDLEKIRTKIDRLIPETLDARYVRFFEEKVKSITALFNSLLDMRKEIAKSIKDEIDIRRRMKDKSIEFDVDELLDVRSMVQKIDNFKDANQKIKEKRIKDSSKEQTDETIIIPGVNDNKGDS